MILDYLLCVLATYRIARMLAIEEGAFSIFEEIRARIDPEQNTWLGRGLNCVHCISFWVSLVFAFLLCHQYPTMQRSETLLAWLGIAGAVSMIYSIVERIEGRQ